MQAIQLSNLAHIAILKCLGYEPLSVKVSDSNRVYFVYPFECRKFLVEPPAAPILSIKDFLEAYGDIKKMHQEAIQKELNRRVKGLSMTSKDREILGRFKESLKEKVNDVQSTGTQENQLGEGNQSNG